MIYRVAAPYREIKWTSRANDAASRPHSCSVPSLSDVQGGDPGEGDFCEPPTDWKCRNEVQEKERKATQKDQNAVSGNEVGGYYNLDLRIQLAKRKSQLPFQFPLNLPFKNTLLISFKVTI